MAGDGGDFFWSLLQQQRDVSIQAKAERRRNATCQGRGGGETPPAASPADAEEPLGAPSHAATNKEAETDAKVAPATPGAGAGPSCRSRLLPLFPASAG